jgi:hypothetical protein
MSTPFILLDGSRSAAKFFYLTPAANSRASSIANAGAPGRTAGNSSRPYAAALASELAQPGLDHLNLFQNVKEPYASSGGTQQPWESNRLVRRVYLSGQTIPVEVAMENPPALPTCASTPSRRPGAGLLATAT